MLLQAALRIGTFVALGLNSLEDYKGVSSRMVSDDDGELKRIEKNSR